MIATFGLPYETLRRAGLYLDVVWARSYALFAVELRREISVSKRKPWL